MDGLYPTTDCWKFPLRCNDGKTESGTGGTWVSSSFIRGRGQTSFATEPYDSGWPDYLTNNTPAVQVFVRVAPSGDGSGRSVYWINGYERPRLVLTRGTKYQFNIMTCGHPFYLTTAETGGQGDVSNVTSVPPTDYFTTTIYIDDKMPCDFYYQCSLHDGMGGNVIIK